VDLSKDVSSQVLQDYSRLTELTQKQEYSDADKNEMLTIMERNEGLLATGESAYIRLNEVREKFIKRSHDGQVTIIPDGRADWIGWFELKKEPIKEKALENTARVIREVKADILCVVEADNRIALNRFNDLVIPNVGAQKYDHVMVIDGNDERGIDVGIMTRQQFRIESMVSHDDDTDEKGRIFSRDCVEYRFKTPSGPLLVLVNHFKSKGYGSFAESNKKRFRQAKKVQEIAEQRLEEGVKFIAICGDLNDTPDSDPLKPLLGNDLGLIDIMKHSKFKGDNRDGTYGNEAQSQKIDYILMSPELSDVVVKSGVERRGVWGGVNGTLFPHFPEILTRKDAASDHAALWVDLNL
jgi:endonuclease/exonuclease/phosphatase family metal-dependent hydrolase